MLVCYALLARIIAAVCALNAATCRLNVSASAAAEPSTGVGIGAGGSAGCEDVGALPLLPLPTPSTEDARGPVSARALWLGRGLCDMPPKPGAARAPAGCDVGCTAWRDSAAVA